MSSISVPAAVQTTVGDIYRAVFAEPFETFKESALRLLQPVLSFDAAVWGSGVHSTNEMLSVSTLNVPSDMLLVYAATWQPHDFVRSAAVAQPGRAFRNEDILPLADYHRTPIYREFSQPAGIEHALGLVQCDPVTDLGEMVFLFRANPAAAFTEDERALLEYLSPHLVVAWRQSQLAHHYRAAAQGAAVAGAEHEAYAVTDAHGLVHAAGEDFCKALRSVAPGWRGPRLPADLAPLQRGDCSVLVLGDHEFTVRRGETRHLFAATRRAGALGLTPAETRVARLYASGLSQKDIAARLGVSTSTVRNQLASAYQKLDVHSKIELMRALNQGGG
jgi:DNA-binding CsgD family transcriptional regulator